MQKNSPGIPHQNGIKLWKILWKRVKTLGYQRFFMGDGLWKTFSESPKYTFFRSKDMKIPEILIYFAFFSLQSAKNVL